MGRFDLIEVTTWAGLTVHFLRTKLKFCRSIIIETNTVKPAKGPSWS
jgi:hypothetical protein